MGRIICFVYFYFYSFVSYFLEEEDIDISFRQEDFFLYIHRPMRLVAYRRIRYLALYITIFDSFVLYFVTLLCMCVSIYYYIVRVHSPVFIEK